MKTVKTLTLLTICITSIALADDFKTTKGKEYKDVTISRVEPDGIVLVTKSGISKLYFVELPKQVQERFHYDPAKAVQFNAAVQAEVTGSNAPLRKIREEDPQTDTARLALKYLSPEQLATDVRKEAHEKAFSPEEERDAFASTPAGGRCVVRLYGRTTGYADPEALTYVIFNGAGEVINRKKGESNLPRKDGYWWMGVDVFDLPAFEDSLRVRIYHEILAQTLGEYVFRRNQQPERVCCEEFLPPGLDLQRLQKELQANRP